MSRPHLREAMFLYSHQKRQAAVDLSAQSTIPNPRKRPSEEITDVIGDVFVDRFVDGDAAAPHKRPGWPAVVERSKRRPFYPRKRSSDEFEEEVPLDASLAEELADALANERSGEVDDDGQAKFPGHRLLADELNDATANEYGSPFYEEQFSYPILFTLLTKGTIGTINVVAGEPPYVKITHDLAHTSFVYCDSSSLRPSRSLAKELAEGIANEDVEPFSHSDEFLFGLAELTDGNDRFPAAIHPVEEHVADAISDKVGQGLNDGGSAILMRLDSPAKTLLDSIATQSLTDILASELSAEARRRPLLLWVSSWAIQWVSQ
ncbi:hypothetical protein B0T20DRAFT_494334 [Sordaria brevicollis]|uniref:Uncharacterized protein n=1 Tax=Sordaria brevicollis TaxID=83679 RepID=A0AAE0PJ74_SORBR|nr:hypothetical protein B0T20DRAFT_494334 [Sordaria brevicollis]